ncbi:hypothetical protein SEA_BRUHMOMENT_57 [Arthrobacter phage BruhMoment]|nr:hypothetical protein SEA_BRUHMOMENT_57 [Arthrobacter phage BruhMoment]
MSTKPPERLFWIEVTGGKVAYNKRGGGKMSSKKAALDRIEYLRKQGVEAVLHESDPITWKRAEA